MPIATDQSAHDRDEDGPPIAPRWHTAALMALIVMVAALGWLLGPSSQATRAPSGAAESRIEAWLPLLAVQGGLTLYVCRIGRGRNVLGALLGKGWTTARRAGIDLALAIALVVVVEGTAVVAIPILGAARAASVAAILPATAMERIAWVLVALFVAFGEEVVFRGYLQIQIIAFTGSTPLGVILQAALFALAHGQQGARGMALAAISAVAFGIVVRAQRSLWPAILGHAAIDLIAGLLAR